MTDSTDTDTHTFTYDPWSPLQLIVWRMNPSAVITNAVRQAGGRVGASQRGEAGSGTIYEFAGKVWDRADIVRTGRTTWRITLRDPVDTAILDGGVNRDVHPEEGE